MSAHSEQGREARRAELMAKLTRDFPVAPAETCRFCGAGAEQIILVWSRIGYACDDRFACAQRLAAHIRRNSFNPTQDAAA